MNQDFHIHLNNFVMILRVMKFLHSGLSDTDHFHAGVLFSLPNCLEQLCGCPTSNEYFKLSLTWKLITLCRPLWAEHLFWDLIAKCNHCLLITRRMQTIMMVWFMCFISFNNNFNLLVKNQNKNCFTAQHLQRVSQSFNLWTDKKFC